LSRGPNFRSLYGHVSKISRTAKLVAALALFLPDAAHTQEAPDVAARAWALTDVRSGEVLAGENASARLPMASTTKIMVALVALEEANLEEEVTVSEEAAAFANSAYSNVGLLAGDVLSVRELLMATMISSGDGSVQRFVEKMNREAEVSGLDNTHFENPVGFDARDQYSTSSWTGPPTSSVRLECWRIYPAPRGPARSSARSWSRWTESGSGRACS
jgi:D-alanyl-D-alanine carboxypeptidase